MTDTATLVDQARAVAAEGERITRDVYLPLATRIRDEALLPILELVKQFRTIEAQLVAHGEGAQIKDVRVPGSTVAFGLLTSNVSGRAATVQLPDVDDADAIWGKSPHGDVATPEPTLL